MYDKDATTIPLTILQVKRGLAAMYALKYRKFVFVYDNIINGETEFCDLVQVQEKLPDCIGRYWRCVPCPNEEKTKTASL